MCQLFEFLERTLLFVLANLLPSPIYQSLPDVPPDVAHGGAMIFDTLACASQALSALFRRSRDRTRTTCRRSSDSGQVDVRSPYQSSPRLCPHEPITIIVASTVTVPTDFTASACRDSPPHITRIEAFAGPAHRCHSLRKILDAFSYASSRTVALSCFQLSSSLLSFILYVLSMRIQRRRNPQRSNFLFYLTLKLITYNCVAYPIVTSTDARSLNHALDIPYSPC